MKKLTRHLTRKQLQDLIDLLEMCESEYRRISGNDSADDIIRALSRENKTKSLK